MTSRQFIVYALSDPRTGMVRYIGKTSGDLRVRLRAHIGHAKRGNRRHVYRWIAQVVAAGYVPTISVIEACPSDSSASTREVFWIAFYRENSTLTNLTDGGDGFVGLKFSDAHRKKLSLAKLGKKQSPEHLAARIKGLTGRVCSPAARAKIGAAHRGMKHTDEVRAVIKAKRKLQAPFSEATKAKLRLARAKRVFSAETRAKISASQKGKIIPQWQRDMIRATLLKRGAEKRAASALKS